MRRKPRQRPTALGHGARYRARRKRTAPRGQYRTRCLSLITGQVKLVSLTETSLEDLLFSDLKTARLQLDAHRTGLEPQGVVNLFFRKQPVSGAVSFELFHIE